MVGGPWKTYVGVGLEFPWAFGYSVLPGIAYVLRVNFCNLKRTKLLNFHEFGNGKVTLFLFELIIFWT